MSFATKILNETQQIVFLQVTAEEEMPSRYFILDVHPNKKTLFNHAIAQPNHDLDLDDYGTVLKMGFGTPNDTMIEQWKLEYNQGTAP